MWAILFWIVVGIVIGWNLPQPAWAKSLQDRLVAALKAAGSGTRRPGGGGGTGTGR